jgi:hypothetical protein
MERRKWKAAAVLACVCCGLPSSGVSADPISLELAAGERAQEFFYPPDPVKGQLIHSGIEVQNLSSQTGSFDAEYLHVSPLEFGDKVVGGFQLLDGTMKVSSSLGQGEIRAGYRMHFSGRRIRRLGGNPATVRMMRFDARANVWRRATDLLRADVRAGRVRADIRRIRGKGSDFVLGHHGFSAEDGYAWAVLDRASLYAVGFQPVPEPGAIWLGALAGALLVARKLRRKRS